MYHEENGDVAASNERHNAEQLRAEELQTNRRAEDVKYHSRAQAPTTTQQRDADVHGAAIRAVFGDEPIKGTAERHAAEYEKRVAEAPDDKKDVDADQSPMAAWAQRAQRQADATQKLSDSDSSKEAIGVDAESPEAVAKHDADLTASSSAGSKLATESKPAAPITAPAATTASGPKL